MRVHPDDHEAIARDAWKLYQARFPDKPDWHSLSEPVRVHWRDQVPAYAATLHHPSTCFEEACLKSAIKAFPKRSQYDPDAEVARLKGGE
jgi:hypothetical protein